MVTALATASLLPYLTIHMQSIGLTVDEISMVYLALPLTTFLSPPITGRYFQLIDSANFISLLSFLKTVGLQYHLHMCLCVCVCVCVCAIFGNPYFLILTINNTNFRAVETSEVV